MLPKLVLHTHTVYICGSGPSRVYRGIFFFYDLNTLCLKKSILNPRSAFLLFSFRSLWFWLLSLVIWSLLNVDPFSTLHFCQESVASLCVRPFPDSVLFR